MIIKDFRKLQNSLSDLGVVGTSISKAKPKTAIALESDHETLDEIMLFSILISEEEIRAVTRDLFASGFYNLAVSEAFKAVDKLVSTKAKQPKSSGTPMMESVFSPTKPQLVWSERLNTSEIDEQKGYHRVFSGSMLGIRNPTTHEFEWITDATDALELIVFAQHLLKKTKRSYKP